jgi:hypothetical protein
VEAGVAHAERDEDPLSQELRERPPGDAGDQYSEDVRTGVVEPALAGVVQDTVIARRAGTTSSTGDSGVRTTIGDASSGSQRATGSSRPSSPSSTSTIVAAAVIGLPTDAIRKIVSRFIGGPSRPRAPTTATSRSSPLATAATAPGSRPERTCRSSSSVSGVRFIATSFVGYQ